MAEKSSKDLHKFQIEKNVNCVSRGQIILLFKKTRKSRKTIIKMEKHKYICSTYFRYYRLIHPIPKISFSFVCPRIKGCNSHTCARSAFPQLGVIRRQAPTSVGGHVFCDPPPCAKGCRMDTCCGGGAVLS